MYRISIFRLLAPILYCIPLHLKDVRLWMEAAGSDSLLYPTISRIFDCGRTPTIIRYIQDFWLWVDTTSSLFCIPLYPGYLAVDGNYGSSSGSLVLYPGYQVVDEVTSSGGSLLYPTFSRLSGCG
jgi:hypothetical protein